MDFQNQLTVAQIQAQHLSGPTTDSSLSVRTNRLRGSVNASKAIILGTGVASTIGSNVVYAPIHEFGGVIQRTVKAGSVKLRTNKRGEILRGGKNGQLAIFAGRHHKLFKEVKFAGGKSYTITIPARAPFGHGIADRQPEYTAAFEAVTKDFLEGKN
jgi:phage gpG-like protein